MTDQQGDQDALNKLVDEFGWEPKLYDVLQSKDREKAGYLPFFIGGEGNIAWVKSVQALGKQKSIYVFYPLAGTWVIGSLIEKMGEAFTLLKVNRDGGYDVWLWTNSCYHGDTIIQALVAAAQKEAG